MVQILVPTFGVLIGLAGLALTYLGHRQKVRQDAQEYALRAEELRRIELDREREQQLHEQEASIQREQEANTQRERDRQQASMISGHVALSPSSLNDSWVVPQAVIHNGSNQPIRNVRLSFRGEVINELPLVGTGHASFPMPPMPMTGERYDQLGQITIEFTDVAGIRWRREGHGALQRARQDANGQEIWGAPELPIIERVRQPPAPFDMPRHSPPASADEMPSPDLSTRARLRRRVRPLMPLAMLVLKLVSLAFIAGGIWWLFHR